MAPTETPPVVYDVKAITESYPVSTATVRRAIADGTLSSFTIGRRRYVRAEALDVWFGGDTTRKVAS